MSDINSIVIVGRMTADPKSETTPSGTAYCKFAIASNFWAGKGKEDGVSFINVTTWGALSEIVTKYGKKGMRVGIQGELRQSRWQDKDGNKRSDVFINASSFQMLESKKDGAAPADPTPSQGAAGAAAPIEDADVPF